MGDRPVLDRLPQRVGQRLGDLLTGQHVAGDTHRPAHELVPTAEDRQRDPADVTGRDPGQRRVTHRDRQDQPALLVPRRRESVGQVLVVERGAQERGRHPGRPEELVRLGLGVEVRHLVLAEQRRHPRVVDRDQLPGVLQRRPHHVLHAGLLHRVDQIPDVRLLLLRIHVRPEIGDQERPVRPFERLRQAVGTGVVTHHHFGAQFGQLARLRRRHVPGQRPHRELITAAGQDGPHHTVALSAGSTDNRDRLDSHQNPLLESLWSFVDR